MRWKILFVLLLTAGSLAWALWGLDLHASGEALASYRLSLLVPALLIYFVTLLVRTVRFLRLLDTPVPYRSMLSVMSVGFLAIMVVPLRMGEFVRPYLLKESHGVPFGTAMAAVVLERLMDMTALLVCLGLVALLVDLPGGITVGGIDLLQAGQWVMGSSVVAGLGFVVFVAIAGATGIRWLQAVAARVFPPAVPVIESLGHRFVGGFRSLAARPFDAFVALVCTAIIWFGSGLAAAVTMAGFDDLQPTFELVLVNWTASITAMTLGPTPGFVGPFEAGCVGSLVLMGADVDVARAYALTMHAVMFIFTVLTGGFFLAIEGWSLLHLVRASREARSSAS